MTRTPKDTQRAQAEGRGDEGGGSHHGLSLKTVMTRNIEVVAPEALVEEAARKMKALNVGALPVCDGARLTGMITDRDITIRVVASGRDPAGTAVRQAMSEGLVYCFEDQSMADAARLMEEKQIRRLPILNRDKQLVGIVSLGDLAVKGGGRAAADALHGVSQPAEPRRKSA